MMRIFSFRAWWHRFPLRVKTALVAGIPVVAIVLGLPLLFSVQRDAARVSDSVERSYLVRQGLAVTLQHLVDAETGMRGYLLTNQQNFLQPYRIAVKLLPEDVHELGMRIGADTSLRARFEHLGALVEERLSILDRTRRFAARTPGNPIPTDLLERGRMVTEQIRDVVDEMDTEVRTSLAREQEKLQAARRMAVLVSVFAIPIALLITVVAVFLFTSGLVRGIRRIEENARRLERGDPLLNPPHGDDELARLGRVLVGTAAQLAKQEAELRDLALVDFLTGLPNRRAFLQIAEHELQVALRSSSLTALLFLDADGLKQVNDDLGHDVGDEMLKEVADVLREELRASDLIARVGGDEFCVLLSRDSSLDGTDVVQRLQAAVARRNQQPERRYALGFSVGIALYDPAKPVPIDVLIRRADAEMYQQKRAKQVARMAG